MGEILVRVPPSDPEPMMTEHVRIAAHRPPVRPTSRARRLVGPGLLALGGAVSVGLVAVRDPNEAGHYPGCPFLATTGFFCPGCGTMRATRALVEGDLGAALGLNPLLVVAIPLLLLAWVAAVRRAWTGRPRQWIMPPWLLNLIPPVIGAYWVLRNVPGFEFLGPGA